MDENNYVPIIILASFHEIQKLTNDINLITQVIKGKTKNYIYFPTYIL